MNTEDNMYSYMSAMGEAQTSQAGINNEVNSKRQRFESDKSADVSAHILLNGVMHKPIDEAVKYIGGKGKEYAQNKVTNALKGLKNKALKKYQDLQDELKTAGDAEKEGIQNKINDSLKGLKKAQQNLNQKLSSKNPSNDEPEPGVDKPPETETVQKLVSPEETETTPAFEREISPERKVITQDAKPEISETVDKPHLARSQPSEEENLKNVNDSDDLTSIQNRITARYNNLDGDAQKSSDKAYDAVKQGGDVEDQTLEEETLNAGKREATINLEEKNPFTTFKNPDLEIKPNENIVPDDNVFGRIARQRNQESFDNPAEQETRITQQAQSEESLTIPARTETVPAQTVVTKPAQYKDVEQEVKTDSTTAGEDEGEDTGKVVGKAVGKMFEKDVVEGASESALDPFAIIGQLLIGAVTTLPSILKKQKQQPVQAALNPSSAMNVGEI